MQNVRKFEATLILKVGSSRYSMNSYLSTRRNSVIWKLKFIFVVIYVDRNRPKYHELWVFWDHVNSRSQGYYQWLLPALPQSIAPISYPVHAILWGKIVPQRTTGCGLWVRDWIALLPCQGKFPENDDDIWLVLVMWYHVWYWFPTPMARGCASAKNAQPLRVHN